MSHVAQYLGLYNSKNFFTSKIFILKIKFLRKKNEDTLSYKSNFKLTKEKPSQELSSKFLGNNPFFLFERLKFWAKLNIVNDKNKIHTDQKKKRIWTKNNIFFLSLRQ